MTVIKSQEPSTAYWATTSQPKSVISWFTSSKRSGSLCNVRRPSGVSVLNKIYVGIAPSSFADQSCEARDLFPASRWGHIQTSPLLANQRQVARFTHLPISAGGAHSSKRGQL